MARQPYNPFLALAESAKRRREENPQTSVSRADESNPFLMLAATREADRARRAQEEEERLYREIYNSEPEEEEGGDKRSLLARLINQINIFDGGKSWGQHESDDTRSTLAQTWDGTKSLASAFSQGKQRVGTGIGRRLSGADDQETEAFNQTQQMLSDTINRAREKANDESLDQATRARWDALARQTTAELDDIFNKRHEQVDERIEAYDPTKMAGAIVESASFGTGGTTVRAAGMTKKGIRSAVAARRGSSVGTPERTVNLKRATGAFAADGAITGASIGVQKDEADAGSIAGDAIFGASLSGVMGQIGGRLVNRRSRLIKEQADRAMMEGVDESASRAAKYLDAEDATRSMMEPKRTLMLGDGSENIAKRIKDLDDELASLGEGSTFKARQGGGVEIRPLTEEKFILDETPIKEVGRVVYHGTNADFKAKPKTGRTATKRGGFQTTSEMAFFSDNKEVSKFFAKDRTKGLGGKANVGEYVLDDSQLFNFSSDWSNEGIIRSFEKLGYKRHELYTQDGDFTNLLDTKLFRDRLIKSGYKGVKFKEKGGNTYGVVDESLYKRRTGKTEIGQRGPETPIEKFVIEPSKGTTTVTPGTFQNNAQRIREIKRQRAALQNELDSINVQREVNANYTPKVTEKAFNAAAKGAKTADDINTGMKFTDYKGRITDNLSSFFKSLEGLLESTGGGRLMTHYYQKTIGGLAKRNEAQKVMSRNLNANMDEVFGKRLSNRQKRKIGTEVGDTLRKVSEKDMAEMTASQIATKYGVSTENAKLAKVLRQHFKDLLEEVNKVRVERGQQPIPYRSEYMPQWSKNRVTDGSGRSASLASEKYNPFAQARTGNNADFERNVFKVIDQYHRYASNELYLTPVVRDLRKISKQLVDQGNLNGASFLDEFIETAILKNKPAGWDKAWGITEGSLRQRALQRISMARSLSGLAGNLRWMFVTQPQSLGVTVGKFGPINTAKGMLDYATNPALRREIRNLPLYRLKRSQSIGATAGGQLDRLNTSVLKSRREFANDIMGLPANFIEQTLDGMSAAAARRNALGHMKNGKMTKEGMKNFMQHGIEVTQSVYSAEARPMVLQNLAARAGFPFQTYSVEMWRHVNNLSRGKGAGWNQTVADRARQATVMVSAILLGNYLQKQATGQDIASPGSVVPFVGGAVDKGIDWATAMFGEGTNFSGGGNQGLTAFERDIGDFAGVFNDISDSFKGDGDLPVGFSEGLQDYLETGKVDKFRKLLTRWGMGLAGVGGASTVNRFMDMAVDFNRESIKTGKKRDIPFERTPKNVITSALFGRGALPQVEEFYSSSGGHNMTQSEWDMMQVIPEEHQRAYADFFGSNKDDPAKKSVTAKKIRRAVDDKNLEKARRLAAEYNRDMAKKIHELEREVGTIDRVMLKYLQTYMIDFDYYRRQYNKK